MKEMCTKCCFDLRAVFLGLALSTFSALFSLAQGSIKTEQRDTTRTGSSNLVVQGQIITDYDHSKDVFVGGTIKLHGIGNYNSVRVILLDSSSREIAYVIPTKTGSFKIPLDWSKNPAGIRVNSPRFYPKTIYFKNHVSINKLVIDLIEEPNCPKPAGPKN